MRCFSFCLLFLLCVFAPKILNAQNDSISDDENAKKDWEKGYIVLNSHKDTMTGYLNIKTANIGYIKQVWFRKDLNEKSETLKIGGYLHLYKDSLRYFGVGIKRFRWVHWTDMVIPTKKIIQQRNSLSGWVELIEEGAVNISLGFSANAGSGPVMMNTPGNSTPMMVGGTGSSYTPMFCLKKGNNPLALIAGYSISFNKNDLSNFKVDERNRDYFIGIIADDFELTSRLMGGDLRFLDIQSYIHEYNEWAKNKK